MAHKEITQSKTHQRTGGGPLGRYFARYPLEDLMLLRARWAAVSTVLDTILRLESRLPMEGAKRGLSRREAWEDNLGRLDCVWSWSDLGISFTSALTVIKLLLVAVSDKSTLTGPFGNLRRSVLFERARLLPESRSLWDAASFKLSSSPEGIMARHTFSDRSALSKSHLEGRGRRREGGGRRREESSEYRPCLP